MLLWEKKCERKNGTGISVKSLVLFSCPQSCLYSSALCAAAFPGFPGAGHQSYCRLHQSLEVEVQNRHGTRDLAKDGCLGTFCAQKAN